MTSHAGLLGTVVGVQVQGDDPEIVHAADAAAIHEIVRLEKIFNYFDDRSQLRRWQRGETDAGPELVEVLDLALVWQSRSSGAFNPSVSELTDIWSDAAERGAMPSQQPLADVVSSIADPRFGTGGERIRAPSQDSVNLNAVAKGWIVDRAVDTALSHRGVEAAMINAGGDIRHKGTDPPVIGIENPHRPFDNEPPLIRVTLPQNGALATSGGARRGWTIGGERFSHVLDPRTGVPVDEVASASVLADNAATADVIATIVTVLGVAEGLAFVGAIDGVGCCLVDKNGSIHRNKTWTVYEIR